jgi:asparagine synthase (glutamine-hydrolysing)
MTMPGLAPEIVDYSDLGLWKHDLLCLASGVDEPFDALMNLPRAVYLAAHRVGCSVLLDGVAGDVVLTHGTQIARLLRSGRFVQAVRDAVGEERFWGPALPAWRTLAQSARTAVVPQWLRRMRHRARQYRGAPAVADEGLIDPAFARRIGLARRRASLRMPPPRRWLSHAEERTRSITGNSLLVGRERYDRVAASLAIEPRDPFTDLRMVAFCLQLPGAQLQCDGWPKLILRRAMAKRLPDTVIWRLGKENLGWTFTQTLFNQWAVWSDAAPDERQMLSAYVSSEHLPISLIRELDTRRQLDAKNESSLSVVSFKVVLFFEWLRQQGLS